MIKVAVITVSVTFPHKCSNTIQCVYFNVLACSNVHACVGEGIWFFFTAGFWQWKWAALFSNSKCFHGGKSRCSLPHLQRDTQPKNNNNENWQQKRINCSLRMRKASVCPRNLHNKDEEDRSEKLLCIHCWYHFDAGTVKLPWIIKSATLHNRTAPEYKCDLNLY